MIIAQVAGGYSLGQLAIAVVIIAAVVALVYVALRAIRDHDPALGDSSVLDHRRCVCRDRGHQDRVRHVIVVLLDSSVLTSAAYDEHTHTLRLTFTSGDVYDYEDIPDYLFAVLIRSDSAGSVFNEAIRPNFVGKLIERKKPSS